MKQKERALDRVPNVIGQVTTFKQIPPGLYTKALKSESNIR